MTDVESPLRPVEPPTAADLDHARHVVAAELAPTPLIRLPLDDLAGADVYAKLETLQPTGSFKVRGALAAVSAAGADQAGVITASAGNHGLGVAYAATRLGVPCTIVVPANASPAKIEGLRRLGVGPVLHGESYDEAEAHALTLARSGPPFISAYNDPHVIAGQATCLEEVREQLHGGFTVVVPVGGGGLLAGTVLAAHGPTRAAASPWSSAAARIRVIGVESAASRAVSTAAAAAAITTVEVGPTLADGLAGNLEAGSVTPGLAAAHGVEFAAVGEEHIAEAVRLLATRCGLIVEGAGAVGLAALLAGEVEPAGPVVLLLTGRNIAAAALSGLIV
ncbi:threonine ammonia-lyase [Catenuloplanes atrovinosus]|uniref:threonine ammonia-lyase n=1 Tax=Catenuloplanes atrovinosus TaxID=137266 RepID=A0AAE4CAP8_9ACTN|nr:pyridoxal-phosphate dependent enzyme [Catenuloplanes atrovinosus]MDR7274815.1 threonine dehydratase [Catenuloplanes atrovinosus]